MHWLCEALGLTRGALVAALSEKLGTPRDRIYRVIRGELGLSPGALWEIGHALRDLGVWQMSGPLALALEPRYDAHLLGAVGELVLEQDHFLWRGALYDFLSNRWAFRDPRGFGVNAINTAGALAPPLLELFDVAWERWYAFDASELEAKEREEHFSLKAPSLARAITILRAQQRDRDADSREKSYRLLINDLNKDIREYFEVGGYLGKPAYAREKHLVASQPRFDLLANEKYAQSAFWKQLRRSISPGGKRPKASTAYRNGWHTGVKGASGLLALALLDYEREFYLLIARIIAPATSNKEHSPLLPIIERYANEKQTTADVELLLHYKTWWKAAWAIACLIGPLDEPLSFLSADIGDLVARYVAENRGHTTAPWLLEVSDYHEALFSESDVGRELRNLIEIPDSAASDLSEYSISSIYTPSDYESTTTPTALATVLDMLHRTEFGYPTGTTRTELFWWFRDVEAVLDTVN